MSDDAYTEAEITEFSDRLQEWGSSLSEREQALLRTLVSRASSGEGGEVEGFSFGRSFPSDTFFPSETFSQPAPTGDLAQTALRPMANTEPPWKLSAYDEWNPTQ